MKGLVDQQALHDSIGEFELFQHLTEEELRECGCHFDEDGEFYFTDEQWSVMAALYIAIRKHVLAYPATHPFEALGRGCFCWECEKSRLEMSGRKCYKNGVEINGELAGGVSVADCHFCSYGKKREAVALSAGNSSREEPVVSV